MQKEKSLSQVCLQNVIRLSGVLVKGNLFNFTQAHGISRNRKPSFGNKICAMLPVFSTWKILFGTINQHICFKLVVHVVHFSKLMMRKVQPKGQIFPSETKIYKFTKFCLDGSRNELQNHPAFFQMGKR